MFLTFKWFLLLILWSTVGGINIYYTISVDVVKHHKHEPYLVEIF